MCEKMKEKYNAPAIRMVRFRTERGFAASVPGFSKAASDADFISLYSGQAEEFNGKYNEQFDEDDINSLW